MPILESVSLLGPHAPVIEQTNIWREGASVDIQDLEAFLHLGFSELRSTLVPLVEVLVVNSTVMLAGILAALDHEKDEAEDL